MKMEAAVRRRGFTYFFSIPKRKAQLMAQAKGLSLIELEGHVFELEVEL